MQGAAEQKHFGLPGRPKTGAQTREHNKDVSSTTSLNDFSDAGELKYFRVTQAGSREQVGKPVLLSKTGEAEGSPVQAVLNCDLVSELELRLEHRFGSDPCRCIDQAESPDILQPVSAHR